MKLETPSLNIQKYVDKTIPFMMKYQYLIIGSIIVAIFALVTLRIEVLTTYEVDETTKQEGLTKIKKINFDQDAIKQIEDLRQLDFNVKPDFPENRTNPFEG